MSWDYENHTEFSRLVSCMSFFLITVWNVVFFSVFHRTSEESNGVKNAFLNSELLWSKLKVKVYNQQNSCYDLCGKCHEIVQPHMKYKLLSKSIFFPEQSSDKNKYVSFSLVPFCKYVALNSASKRCSWK